MFPTKLEGNCKQPRLSSRSSPFNPDSRTSPPLYPFIVPQPATLTPAAAGSRGATRQPFIRLVRVAETRYQTVMKSLSSTRFLLEPFMHRPARNALIQARALSARVHDR